MTIQRLGPEHLAELYANRLRSLKETPSAFLVSYDEEMMKGSRRFLETLSHQGPEKLFVGALENGKVIGHLALFQGDLKSTAHTAQIYGMCVDKGFQGQGIGGKILDFALAHAKNEMKVLSVSLAYETSNKPAQKLYESRGFKVWGLRTKIKKIGDTFYDESFMTLDF
jgi:ribosomal protein S18 acetylase RimI-like enzyme